jgi:hypothetical protein
MLYIHSVMWLSLSMSMTMELRVASGWLRRSVMARAMSFYMYMVTLHVSSCVC